MLRPLDFWDSGLYFDRGRERLCLVFVVCCALSGNCEELIALSEESYRLFVCHIVTTKMGQSGHSLTVASQKEIWYYVLARPIYFVS